MARRLIVVNPITLEYVQLSEEVVGIMDLDRYGRLYYAKGKELYRLIPPGNLFK
ncbi:hypothetical protein RE628_27910 [Paenibacillus sp. D2_2]|uniref:hypothetical protein n=1 Tax=Paenibacillus sp. D2_2 TaxID=3073092 RepID=UPI0028159271|nr:hypothetical protein [Paenibacillus sp. D2_2]WMT40865.1 hypothetical protein RE628_27910 [Paenibacillus sp. D2_2]